MKLFDIFAKSKARDDELTLAQIMGDTQTHEHPHKASIETAISSSIMTLNDAVIKKDSAAVMRLLAEGQDPNGVRYAYMNCEKKPLETALQQGDSDIVAILLEYGANPNILTSDVDRLPILSIAVMDGSIPRIKLMLQHGADPFMANENGTAAIDFAAQQPAIKALLIKYTDSNTINPHVSSTFNRVSPVMERALSEYM